MVTARVAVAALLVASCASLQAADYPQRPIRLIVPFAAGGGLEITARSIGQKLTEKRGQSIVIDNRPGAATIVGSEITAKASPDGYTLLMITTTFAINPSLYGKLPYDPNKDFAPVTQITSVPNILVVNPSIAAHNVRELIALAKAKPGQLNYASAGSGTSPHLAAELFKTMAGIEVTHIPYKGIPPAVTDVIAGRVTMLMTTTISAAPHVKSGRLRALAITSPKRLAAMPDVPAIGETVPGYEADAFQGMVAPAGVPKEIVRQLADDIAAIVRQPDIRERILADGAEPIGSTPEAFGAFLKKEMLKWGKVVKESGARPD
ncbi:MAG TPA: tripartite tricarboxylate transporter substrate binding protein [Burkholderiales bacterium]|nr:tripartite tricarboxylate transporter substrate binding protein [Burkholderiales bacterium]